MTSNHFENLPCEIQNIIYEKCGKEEWSEKVKEVNKDVRTKKKAKEFSDLLFRARTDINALWQVRNAWK